MAKATRITSFTAAGNKVYFSQDDQLMWMAESGGLVARQPVAGSPACLSPRLAAHGNTLLLIPEARQLPQRSLHVIDCTTNTRVGQLTSANRAPGSLVDCVAVSDDTVAVQLVDIETDLNKIEIWRMKTAAPTEGSLALERTLTVPKLAGETPSYLAGPGICINDNFLVKCGWVEWGSRVQWFKRKSNDMDWRPSALPVEVVGVDYRRLRVMWAQLCRGDSGMLALGIQLSDRDPDDLRAVLPDDRVVLPDVSVVLQVRDLHRGGEVVLQHHFGLSVDIERIVKADWCGPHLLVATTRLWHHAVSLLCWQPGDPGLLNTPVTVPTDKEHVILEHFHADMEQMVLAARDPGELETKILMFKNQP